MDRNPDQLTPDERRAFRREEQANQTARLQTAMAILHPDEREELVALVQRADPTPNSLAITRALQRADNPDPHELVSGGLFRQVVQIELVWSIGAGANPDDNRKGKADMEGELRAWALELDVGYGIYIMAGETSATEVTELKPMEG